MRFCKYSGSGNSFILMDGRAENTDPFCTPSAIGTICEEFSTDGVIILEDSADGHDFSMRFFNPDGSTGMMCGNGGRCMISFAVSLGIKPSAEDGSFIFDGPDGVHTGKITSSDGPIDTVRLKMCDVDKVTFMPTLKEAPVDGYFLNTGTRHFVLFEDSIEEINAFLAGRAIRNCEEFAPEGTNVDFVAPYASGLSLRTYEKGVEQETLACGTGAVAAAVAAYKHGIEPTESSPGGRVKYRIKVAVSSLEVDFLPAGDGAEDIFLTGPVSFILCTN